MIANFFDVFYRSVFFFFSDPTISFVFIVIVVICIITSFTKNYK